MKKVFFRYNSPCFTHLLLFFTGKNVPSFGPRESTGPSCGTSRGPNDGMFWGRLQDFGHICILNSTQKHIKFTLTGYSRLYSELR